MLFFKKSSEPEPTPDEMTEEELIEEMIAVCKDLEVTLAAKIRRVNRISVMQWLWLRYVDKAYDDHTAVQKEIRRILTAYRCGDLRPMIDFLTQLRALGG